MGFPERPSSIKRLISRKDPSLAIYDRETIRKYHFTLDIGIFKLKETKFTDPPFIFHCLPLRAKLANLYSEGNMSQLDWWRIFQTHVVEIENIPPTWDIKKDGDYLDDTVQERFGDELVKDIAQMIVQWANADGDLIPFRLQPETLVEQDLYRRKLHVKLLEADAALEAAKIKSTKSAKKQKKK